MDDTKENIKTELKALIGTNVSKYTITRYINSGSFGHVFEGKDKKTGELVALKMPVKTEERDGTMSLLAEARIYKVLACPEKGVAEMKIIKWKDQKIIVMDLLGASLDELFTKHKRFGIKTIISLAISMIDTIKYIHSCGFLHRDIKPDNFAIDIKDPKKLYCIDFGISKRYLKRNGEHIEFSDKKKFCGTARYASIAAHKNMEQSRKDDLEAIGYVLVYLFKSKLPWQGIKHKDKKERYRLIGEKKEQTTEEELCADMPKEFLVYMKYVRNLDFHEKPHYSALKKMFLNLYQSKGFKNDNLEWEV
jgi:serine/threonine protein kinase